MGSIGTGELLLIFMVVLLVFGAKRIPEIARSLGTAITEFRSATREIQRQLEVESRVQPPREAARIPRERQQASEHATIAAAVPSVVAPPPTPEPEPTPGADSGQI